jgi:hypothetical protein
MKYLDDQSAEYKHTRSIHDELDRIAVRCEEELVISAVQLTDLKERLDNKFECIKDHRKLLWHGPLKKQSPRRHADIAQRYMILFSDCILVCSEESGRKLDIKRELTIKGLTIDVIQGGRISVVPNNDQLNNVITYYPFRVNAVEKSYEFLADKQSDREIWVKKIRQASEDYDKRNAPIESKRIFLKYFCTNAFYNFRYSKLPDTIRFPEMIGKILNIDIFLNAFLLSQFFRISKLFSRIIIFFILDL